MLLLWLLTALPYTMGVETFRRYGDTDRRDANPAPSLVWVLNEFADNEWR
jgi:hypothetical protein